MALRRVSVQANKKARGADGMALMGGMNGMNPMTMMNMNPFLMGMNPMAAMAGARMAMDLDADGGDEDGAGATVVVSEPSSGAAGGQSVQAEAKAKANAPAAVAGPASQGVVEDAASAAMSALRDTRADLFRTTGSDKVIARTSCLIRALPKERNYLIDDVRRCFVHCRNPSSVGVWSCKDSAV